MRNKIILSSFVIVLIIIVFYAYKRISINSTDVNNSTAFTNNKTEELDSNSDLNNGLYYYKAGQQQDYAKAFKFFERAGKNNNPESFFYLGVCYLKGLGTPRDHEKAFFYFTKGANLNHGKSMTNLAFCYYNGIGVKSDSKVGDYWTREREKLLPELPITVIFSEDSSYKGCLGASYSLNFNDQNDSNFFQFKIQSVSQVDQKIREFGIYRLSKSSPTLKLNGTLYFNNNSPAILYPGDTLILSRDGYRPMRIVCPNLSSQ